jgi:hypothetical protein
MNSHWVDLTGKGASPQIDHQAFANRTGDPLDTTEVITDGTLVHRVKIKDSSLTAGTSVGMFGVVPGVFIK